MNIYNCTYIKIKIDQPILGNNIGLKPAADVVAGVEIRKEVEQYCMCAVYRYTFLFQDHRLQDGLHEGYPGHAAAQRE